MKCVFVVFAVLIVSTWAVPREKRFLIDRCSSEADCGPNKCCLMGKICSPKLPKYSTCLLTGLSRCGCADGLACRVTKEVTLLGQTIQLRQCMDSGEEVRVEQLDDQDVEELVETRVKRFLVDKCTTESDCGDNRCCAFGKYCAPKLPEGSTCYLSGSHKCGCKHGLECRITTTITIPIVGTQIPIRQCVKQSA